MLQAIIDFLKSTGIYAIFSIEGMGGNLIMIMVALLLLYLAIKKGFEPLLLLPIAFGMLLTNLPLAGMMASPIMDLIPKTPDVQGTILNIGNTGQGILELNQPGGLFYYLFQGDHLGIFPPLI
ncbi:MAG: glutaconyl-CoA decarboxylase subunit beta, partial [Bacteroidetes bacterium 4572_77]